MNSILVYNHKSLYYLRIQSVTYKLEYRSNTIGYVIISPLVLNINSSDYNNFGR